MVSSASGLLSMLANRVREQPSFLIAKRCLGSRSSVRVRAVVNPRTDLVIDGFPRSANTFAYFAFVEANPSKSLRIANHIHSSAQFSLAARYGVPALLVTRAPRSCLASYAQYMEGVDLGVLLDRYIRFHRGVLASVGHCVVSDFEQTTMQLDKVIGQVNERFGSDFVAPPMDEAFVARVRRTIEQQYDRLRDELGDVIHEGKKAVPTSRRHERRDALIEQIEGPWLASRLEEADALHAQLLSGSSC